MTTVFSILMPVLFLVPTAHADILSQEAQFRRCFAHLVRARPAENDPDLIAVQNGHMVATGACMQLLRRAQLGPTGTVNLKDPVAQPILRTLQALHSSWFTTHELVQVETDFPTTNHLDTNEMGYHFTYSILAESEKFSNIVTRNSSWRGKRESTVIPQYFIDTKGNETVFQLSAKPWGMNEGVAYQPDLVGFGKLIGIAPLVPEPKIGRKLDNGEILEFSPNASLGGGLLGTPTYILLNSTMRRGVEPDDGIFMHRSWSRAVIQDLLCRSLPVLNLSDVRGVRSDGDIPFRKHASCMQCHSTMDPMAAVLRNIQFTGTNASSGIDSFYSLTMMPHRPLRARELASRGDYARTFPAGNVYMRDYQGRLVDEHVDGVESMGRQLAKMDDLYICAAKRYFEFFTGIDVQIRDFSNDGEAVKKSPYYKYREFVIDLGRKLKEDQSVPELFKRIFASEFYRSSSYGMTP